MSATPGPSIITNGLVLEIDAANTAKLALGSNSTNFIQNGYFANGADSPQNIPGTNNPTNTLVILPNPGESDYVLRQNGNLTEYELQLTTQMLPSTTYVMSGWYAKSADYNSIDTMFHSRAFSASGNNIATADGIGTVITTKVIGGLTWSYCYQTITTPSDYSNAFSWYVGYGANNTTGFRYYTNLKVEQGTFPSFPDLTFSGNSTRVINSPTYSSTNLGGMTFNAASSQRILINTASNLIKTTNATMQIVVNNTTWNAVQQPFVSYRYSSGASNLYFGKLNNTLAFFYNGLFNATSPTVNVPHMYTLTIQDTGTASLYIDGVLTNTYTIGSLDTSFVPSLNIAWDGGNAGDYWSGTFYNFAHYNRVLSGSEVLQNFNALRSRYGI